MKIFIVCGTDFATSPGAQILCSVAAVQFFSDFADAISELIYAHADFLILDGGTVENQEIIRNQVAYINKDVKTIFSQLLSE